MCTHGEIRKSTFWLKKSTLSGAMFAYENWDDFCVTCVAWQTHRDHVVRPLCCRPASSASAVSSSHFPFPFNNFWRDVLISFKVCRTLYHYKIQVKFDIGNHLPNFYWVMALFWLSFCCSFPINNFWRDSLISFKLCRTLYHCKIQVKFDIGNHLPNFGWVMTFFDLVFVGVLILVSSQ